MDSWAKQGLENFQAQRKPSWCVILRSQWASVPGKVEGSLQDLFLTLPGREQGKESWWLRHFQLLPGWNMVPFIPAVSGEYLAQTPASWGSLGTNLPLKAWPGGVNILGDLYDFLLKKT